jgi:bifunctional DNA-binding transcriptional regulator/antitoxin component of YhaV-PrlF toxin-antitoxin module
MSEKQSEYSSKSVEKRRIHVSSKRQITIPAKYYEALGSVKEMECIYSNDMLILNPVQFNETGFSEEILSDLIDSTGVLRRKAANGV